MAKTSSQTDFLIISQTITALSVDLSKIANDLKFMASGPRGGIGEIILPELQKGSSIMPGKINPVMPETVNQLYYLVSGNNLSIEKAAEGSQMELGVMLPIIVDKLIESIKLTTEVIHQFDKLCVQGIKADKEKCKYYLENGTAYATLLVPRLGYDLVSKIVKESIFKNKKSVFCPYFNTEVILNADGFHHLQFSGRTERNKNEQLLKLNLSPLAISVIKKSGTVQEYRKILATIGKKSKTDGSVIMKHIEYWGFVAIVGQEKIKVKAIVRRVGDGNLIFWSVMPHPKIDKNRGQKMFTAGIEED